MPRNSAGDRSEARLALYLGGRQTRASGSQAGDKSDIELDTYDPRFRIECKSTVAESLSVKYEWLTKIVEEAKYSERWPALVLSFTTGNGLPKKYGDWVAVRKEDFLELLTRLDEAEHDQG